MKVNLIIGAGQLGSRHLQGLLKLTDQQIVYVVDPSEVSLNIAKERSMEIPHAHEIFFLQDIKSIPSEIDLAIIATNANIRESVIKSLIAISDVKYLILEKVLFDNIAAYKIIETLLEEKGVKTWVNHPRRMFKHYAEIKKQLGFEKGHTVFKVEGSNWGLGCNGLHFLDMFSFLTDSDIASVDTSSLDTQIVPSKRSGFVEFTGTLKGALNDGSNYEIISYVEGSVPISVDIIRPGVQCKITESGVKVEYFFDDTSENKEQQFRPVYQSELTTSLAQSLFETGDCALPAFKSASENHQIFINALLDFEYKITGEKKR